MGNDIIKRMRYKPGQRYGISGIGLADEYVPEQQVVGPTTQTPFRKEGGKQIAPGIKMVDTTKGERRKDAYKRLTGVSY